MIVIHLIVQLATAWGTSPLWLRFGLPLLVLAIFGGIELATGNSMFLGYLLGALILIISLWGTMEYS